MADWKSELDDLLRQEEAEKAKKQADASQADKAIEAFVQSTVAPAFQELKEAFEARGFEVEVYCRNTWAVSIRISNKTTYHTELDYVLEFRRGTSLTPMKKLRLQDEREGRYTAEKLFTTERSHGSVGTFEDITKDDIISDVFQEFKNVKSRKK